MSKSEIKLLLEVTIGEDLYNEIMKDNFPPNNQPLALGKFFKGKKAWITHGHISHGNNGNNRTTGEVHLTVLDKKNEMLIIAAHSEKGAIHTVVKGKIGTFKPKY